MTSYVFFLQFCDVLSRKSHTSVSSVVLQHALLLLVCQASTPTSTEDNKDLYMAVAKSPVLLYHCQKPSVGSFLR